MKRNSTDCCFTREFKGEILAEAVTRNIPAFNRFLEAAALSNGGIPNYTTIARDCGVSSPTVKEYFQILEDALIGRQLPAFRKKNVAWSSPALIVVRLRI